MIDRRELYDMTRDQLIARASKLGVSRPEVLTQAELTDEIISRSTSKARRRKMRGWLGRARDLVARVVERGLHLPDAAKRFKVPSSEAAPKPPPPLPTMTLAEIYAAQGYLAKAVDVLDEVVASDPTHREAKRLCEKLVGKLSPSELAARRERLAQTAAKEISDAPDLSHGGEETVPGATSTGAVEPKEQETPGARQPVALAAQADSEASATTQGEATKIAATEAGVLVSVDHQELVALATNAQTAYIYWEVVPRRFARLRSLKPNGRLVLRALSSHPSQGLSSHDLYVDELRGDTFVHGLRPESVVCFCLGYKSGQDFVALVVGSELTMPRDYRKELGVAIPSQTASNEDASVMDSSEPPLAAASAAMRGEEQRVASTHVRDGIPRWASLRWINATASGRSSAQATAHTPSGTGPGQWLEKERAAEGSHLAARSAGTAVASMRASGKGPAGWTQSGAGFVRLSQSGRGLH